jgi:phytoene synthase
MTGALNEQAQATIDRHARTFSLASRLLPPRVRRDVNLLYLAVRRLDDAVDHGEPDAWSTLERVRNWAQRGSVGCLEASIFERLAQIHQGFPRDAVLDFCAGQSRDLHHRPFETEAELDHYCYQVAGTVGRMMAALLGAFSPAADRAARAMGIAMQRTNILRDLDEDLARGFVYVPRATLRLAGVGDLVHGDRSLLLRIEVGIADWWYEQALPHVHLLPSGRAAVRAAAEMYREILRQIGRDGWGALRPWRARVSRGRRIAVLARALGQVVATEARLAWMR